MFENGVTSECVVQSGNPLMRVLSDNLNKGGKLLQLLLFASVVCCRQLHIYPR